jgi:hypothetical protein
MPTRRLTALVASALLSLFAATTAEARPYVTGRVAGATGYTVLALAPDGHAASAKLGRAGTFRLPAARGARLQLLRPSGEYFGPVVLGRAPRGRVLVALSGRRAALGRIVLKASHAVVARSVRGAADPRETATADAHGRPVGAGKLGLVASHHARSAAAGRGGPGAGQPGGDPDHDGIPSAIDADANGNGKVDAVDSGDAGNPGAGLFTDLQVDMASAINADAAGVTPAAIDRFVSDRLALAFFLDGHAAGGSVRSVGIDCGGLAYCGAAGGAIATMHGAPGTPDTLVPWRSLDADRDGLPDIPADPTGRPVWDLSVLPHVPTAQIHPGDTFQVTYHLADGTTTVAPTALTTYFLTVPVIGDVAASGADQKISYPAAPDAPGTRSNPIVVGPDGTLSVTYWRPQRAALPGEPGSLIDQGGLNYGFAVQPPGAQQEIGCGGDYRGLQGGLEMGTASRDGMFNGLFPLHDAAGDAPPSAARTLGFTFDLGACLARNGVAPGGKRFDLVLTAVDSPRPGGVDRGGQRLTVCLGPCEPEG